MKKIFFSLIFVVSSLFSHSALMSCFDNGDNTVTCEGGFSDGSSASGVEFYVLKDNKKVYKTKMNENSEASFTKPKGEYTAVFNAGEGHQIKIDGSNITE